MPLLRSCQGLGEIRGEPLAIWQGVQGEVALHREAEDKLGFARQRQGTALGVQGMDWPRHRRRTLWRRRDSVEVGMDGEAEPHPGPPGSPLAHITTPPPQHTHHKHLAGTSPVV